MHALLAKCGIRVTMSDLFGLEGTEPLEHLRLPAPYGARWQSLQRLSEDIDVEIDLFARLTRGKVGRHPGDAAVRSYLGSGASWPRSSSPRSATSGPQPGWPALAPALRMGMDVHSLLNVWAVGRCPTSPRWANGLRGPLICTTA